MKKAKRGLSGFKEAQKLQRSLQKEEFFVVAEFSTLETQILSEELRQMSLDCSLPMDSYERSVFLGERGKPLPRVQEIGERLNEIGGFDEMQKVARVLEHLSPLDASELNYAWDGIGSWRA